MLSEIADGQSVWVMLISSVIMILSSDNAVRVYEDWLFEGLFQSKYNRIVSSPLNREAYRRTPEFTAASQADHGRENLSRANLQAVEPGAHPHRKCCNRIACRIWGVWLTQACRIAKPVAHTPNRFQETRVFVKFFTETAHMHVDGPLKDQRIATKCQIHQLRA